jgi:hypothetical protein
MDNLAEKTMRSGAYSTYVPVVRSKVNISSLQFKFFIIGN